MTADTAQTVLPLPSERLDLAAEALCLEARAARRVREYLHDRAHVSLPVRREGPDIAPWCAAQHEADRRHVLAQLVATSQDRVHQRPARTTVAVDERMDRLELTVRDRGLRDRRHVRAGLMNALRSASNSGTYSGGGGTNAAFQRVVVTATDPVLLRAYDAGDRLPVRVAVGRQERPVDLAHGLGRYVLGGRADGDCVLIAAMFASTSRAVLSSLWPCRAQAMPACDICSPSIRDDATLSERIGVHFHHKRLESAGSFLTFLE